MPLEPRRDPHSGSLEPDSPEANASAWSGRASASSPAERGGLLYHAAGLGPDGGVTLATVFISAEVVLEVTALSKVTPVAGVVLAGARAVTIGLALARGQVVTVLSFATPARSGAPSPASRQERAARWPTPGSNRAVLCDVGEVVALVGGEVLVTGLFRAHEDGVLWDGAVVPDLDVRALHETTEAAVWAARARTGRVHDLATPSGRVAR